MTGNIGEWSELYTMFKLLADGKLYAADANTNKIPDISISIAIINEMFSWILIAFCLHLI